MARTGKIARLPVAIRTELNQRLRDGESGSTLLPWLNAQPEVVTRLSAELAGWNQQLVAPLFQSPPGGKADAKKPKK